MERMRIIGDHYCCQVHFTILSFYNERDNKANQDTIVHPYDYVLKPQHESSGYLTHDENMKHMMQNLTSDDQERNILMERIKSKGYSAYLLKERE